MFPKIRHLENRYRRSIARLSADFEGIMDLGASLSRAFSKLENYLGAMKRRAGKSHDDVHVLLDRYLADLRAIHERNMFWINFYCAFHWPSDARELKRKFRRRPGERRPSDINVFWARLESWGKDDRGAAVEVRRILNLKSELDRFTRNSPNWRLVFEELSRRIYETTVAVVRGSKGILKDRFRIVAADVSAHPGEVSPPPHSRPGAGSVEFQGGPLQVQDIRIADWIRGYVPTLRGQQEETVRAGLSATARRVRTYERRMAAGRAARGGAVMLLMAFLLWGLSVSEWDDRLYKIVRIKLMRMFGNDHATVVLMQKKKYFEDQINRIDQDYSAEGIRENIRHFDEQGMGPTPEGYMYFSENILKGFLLLLSDWGLEEGLKTDVVNAANRLDPEAAMILDKIVQIFQEPTIKEYTLGKQLLELRRLYVRHGVFPFMFIALHKEVPYLFLFPEDILKIYSLDREEAGELGLDNKIYDVLSTIPITAYVVDGSKHPFQDRAGHFEGEYAVVFKSLSDNSRWTAYHEMGHVVDNLRYKLGREPIPDNSERNAMLAPAIWARDSRRYVLRHLVPTALKGDPLDFYVQAAKGILNGFSIYLDEKNPGGRAPLITNKLEKTRISAIEDRLRVLSSREINRIALALYKNPDRYLKTAFPGQYVTIISNTHEIIYGAPESVGKRGFILQGSGFGAAANGPRFILGGGGGDMWQGSFNIWSFLSNVLGIVFGKRGGFLQSSKAEALTAAILVFIGFNIFSLSLHAMGGSWRKKRFYGRSPDLIVDRIYGNHPWSTGLSFGAVSRERQLLHRVFRARGSPDNRLKDEIAAFKSTANDRQRTLFDVCLCLAPFNPARSRIVNKLHDLLFFLPFLGPYLGRSSWIWPVQKNFHQREAFNADIERLATSVSGATTAGALREGFKEIVARYRPSKRRPDRRPHDLMEEFSKTEKHVFELLPEINQKYHVNLDFVKDHLSQFQEQSQEFDRLDEYYPGDDIRHIDWNVTARFDLAKPMVRRYSKPYGIKIGFWLDMRAIQNGKGQRAWARDFIRAVGIFNTLGAENILESIIFVMRNGEVIEKKANIKTSKDPFRTSLKILAKIKEVLGEIEARQTAFYVDGLRFYTDNENRNYLNNVQLTDFGQGMQEVRMMPLRIRRANVFMIGSRTAGRENGRNITSGNNRIFYP